MLFRSWTLFYCKSFFLVALMKDYNLILDTGFLTFMSYKPVCCLSYPCLDMCTTSRAAAAMFRSHPGSPHSSHFKLSAVVTRSSLLRQNCNPHGKEVENTGHAVSEDCAAVTKKHFHARPQHGWGCLHRSGRLTLGYFIGASTGDCEKKEKEKTDDRSFSRGDKSLQGLKTASAEANCHHHRLYLTPSLCLLWGKFEVSGC